MKITVGEEYFQVTQAILTDITKGHGQDAIHKLRQMKEEIYADIPAKKRQSRGITWVVQQIAGMFAEICESDDDLQKTALFIFNQLELNDLLVGVAIFSMAHLGTRQPRKVFDFFESAAGSDDWVVREFAAGGFHKVIAAQRDEVHPWLVRMAQADDPNMRRFASETLRPVTDNRWINQEPEYSLSVLRHLFREPHPYPRTSVGNNLSDLSRKLPDLIFSIVNGLASSGDKNSYWIAHRACRNLVKKEPERVMGILGVNEYHYKDRNYYRDNE